jgi:hypothetical protein
VKAGSEVAEYAGLRLCFRRLGMRLLSLLCGDERPISSFFQKGLSRPIPTSNLLFSMNGGPGKI